MVLQFTFSPPSNIGLIFLIAMVSSGVLLIALAFIFGRKSRKVWGTFVLLVVIGVINVSLGIGLSQEVMGAGSTVTVGDGYMQIQSPSFSGAGNINVTSGMVQSAYIGQIGVGNLTISKDHGTNSGNFNVGVFTLGNGATAYVVSNNVSNLVIQLTSGKYVLVGTNNTNLLASAFSRDVHSVTF